MIVGAPLTLATLSRGSPAQVSGGHGDGVFRNGDECDMEQCGFLFLASSSMLCNPDPLPPRQTTCVISVPPTNISAMTPRKVGPIIVGAPLRLVVGMVTTSVAREATTTEDI